MKTPSFWSRRNLTATLLSPLGCLYALATRINLALHKPHKVNTPVLCIGNLTAGGTGKTPTAVSIAKIMQQNNKNPHFVSRGYGGTLHNVIVDMHNIRRSKSAMNLYCLPDKSRQSFPRTDIWERKLLKMPVRISSLWMTASKTPSSIKIYLFGL